LMKKHHFVFLFIILIGCLSGCGANQGISDNAGQDQSTQLVPLPSDTPKPSLTFTPEPTFTPTVTPIVILDPEPIEIKFTTEDGVKLDGLYYPASNNPAPLIVLVHWARGDMTEWEQIALWLQDRELLERTLDHNRSWKSSDWFPELDIEGPVGVFAFTMRDCQGSCQSYSPEEWLLDIEAAMQRAANLQGVDKERIMTAGASIGADGALYGCAWVNQAGFGSCTGSFSLSPASLLTIPYEELAKQLISAEPSLPIYCLFGLRDDASVETCLDLPGLVAVDYGYIENHGFELIQPGQVQDPLLLLNEFINLSLAGVGE